jgi:eukaryotic-like serine/threonine-protein kinase
MTELEGKTLDRYELRRMIGKGGMANVYEAIDRQTGRVVAIKVFKREDVEMLRRFMREAELMASWQESLEHHLVPVYNYGKGELDNLTHYFIVMPFMESGTLRARIRRGPLPLVEACHAIQNVAGALDYIHGQGVIHRDIKASNVLINGYGDYFLTDFGIARITGDATHLTTTGNVLGTVDYVAPELFELDRKADARSDLYSLGILLYEMVTGRLPFIAENQIALVSMHIQRRPPAPRSIIDTIPKPVEAVMLKALEKKPEQRYGSAKELSDAFCRAVASSTGASIPDYGTLAAPVATPASPAPRPSQLILKPLLPQINPDAHTAEVRPSPLAKGTEGIRMPVQNPNPPSSYAGKDAPYSPLPVPYQPPEPARRPYYRRPWFSVMIILLALLIVAGSLAVMYMPRGQANSNPGNGTQTAQSGQTAGVTHAPTTTPNLTATAQAAAAASATARAQATASAIAAVTATAQAQASATAGVIQTATSGHANYSDPLNNTSNVQTAAAGWDQSSHCAFQNDGYHDTTTGTLQGCKEANNTYQNAAITVVMRIASGQSGGVFFRMSNSFFGTYSGYLFEVDATGRYRILSSGNYSLGTPSTLQDWTNTKALKTGGAANLLQVMMRGSNLSFYANGIFLTQLTDTGYSSGQVAFLARSDGSTPAEVVYSDLNVYTLS